MLFLYIALCILLFEAVISFLGMLLGWIYNMFNNHKQRLNILSSEFVDLKHQQKGISKQEEFAKYSKVQRKLNKIEMEMKKLKSNKSTFIMTWKLKASIGLYVLYVACIFSLMLFKRYEPVVNISNIWMPKEVKSILSYPTTKSNVIGLPIWILICRQFSRAFLH
uniref:Guided entry of tail-anchored proteins factor 1 n=1 Tax=Clytia hemisphaerica TaxID=252671 RepID=A0A7M5TZ37_9CNID|eukprot:TCONS_00037463-protein